MMSGVRVLFLAILSLLLKQQLNAQAIPQHFFGQNAWMPDTIGQTSACPHPPCALYGKLHKHWGNIKASGAALIRFGGIAPDRNRPTNHQYIKMIDSIRAKGMEPVIQVPFHANQYTPAQAAAIVQFINVTKGKNIKYWIIANEPDLEYSYTSAAQVAAYIRPFASAMKAVDPTILTIGPETAWFNHNIINGLTSPGGPDDITGKDGNGRYYIDYISFHYYPFNGTQTRAQAITKLSSAGGLQDNLIYLNNRLANCNAYHNRSGSSALKSAITEANINYQNSSTDNLSGNGVNSFLGGQFMAEMFAVGMKNKVDFINIWSVVEGNSTALNIGYIDPPTGNRKAAFYHYKMMADNFRGSFVTGVSSVPNVKVFGSKNSTNIQVMILNQELSGSLPFTLRLNTAGISGNSPLKLNVDAGVAQEYSDAIENQSTILLTFNQHGALLRRCVYSMSQHAANNLPPSCTETSAPLPISVESFNGATDNATVLLQWSRKGPPRTGGYIVERSLDGFVFDSLASVNPKDSLSVSYEMTDASPAPGLNYYRLKQYSADGAAMYSRVQAVNVKAAPIEELRIFPNPSSGKEVFMTTEPGSDQFAVTVSDITGRKIPVSAAYADHNGSRVVTIKPHSELPDGVYMVMLSSGERVSRGKFIVRKNGQQ